MGKKAIQLHIIPNNVGPLQKLLPLNIYMTSLRGLLMKAKAIYNLRWLLLMVIAESFHGQHFQEPRIKFLSLIHSTPNIIFRVFDYLELRSAIAIYCVSHLFCQERSNWLFSLIKH